MRPKCHEDVKERARWGPPTTPSPRPGGRARLPPASGSATRRFARCRGKGTGNGSEERPAPRPKRNRPGTHPGPVPAGVPSPRIPAEGRPRGRPLGAAGTAPGRWGPTGAARAGPPPSAGRPGPRRLRPRPGSVLVALRCPLAARRGHVGARWRRSPGGAPTAPRRVARPAWPTGRLDSAREGCSVAPSRRRGTPRGTGHRPSRARQPSPGPPQPRPGAPGARPSVPVPGRRRGIPKENRKGGT